MHQLSSSSSIAMSLSSVNTLQSSYIELLNDEYLHACHLFANIGMPFCTSCGHMLTVPALLLLASMLSAGSRSRTWPMKALEILEEQTAAAGKGKTLSIAIAVGKSPALKAYRIARMVFQVCHPRSHASSIISSHLYLGAKSFIMCTDRHR